MNAQRVTDEPNKNTIFMVWQFKDNTSYEEAFKDLCALVINLNNSAITRFPESKASCVLGISCHAWKKLELPTPLPKELVPFKEIKGSMHTAVSTPGDLHLHFRADNSSLCVDMAIEITKILQPVADCLVDIQGFRYWDGRSILGFVDGTENPQGADRDFFAKVGEEDANYQGGSYVFVQKYVHDMSAWNKMSVEEQEKVIGRSKQNDIELSGDKKPSNAHVALTNVKGEDGEELKVVRDNMPFRTNDNGEVGTYFIAYASTFSTVQKMLENMFIGNPVGNYDRILDFSVAKTGTLFFAPTMDMLSSFAD